VSGGGHYLCDEIFRAATVDTMFCIITTPSNCFRFSRYEMWKSVVVLTVPVLIDGQQGTDLGLFVSPNPPRRLLATRYSTHVVESRAGSDSHEQFSFRAGSRMLSDGKTPFGLCG
jgi:hypothetical protein